MRFRLYMQLWRTCYLWCLVTLNITGASAATPEPLQSYTAQPLRTAAVNSSGSRHDATSTECITAPPKRLFEQITFSTRAIHHFDDDEHRCSPMFSEYKEFVPGVLEPTTVCLNSYVKSKGGVLNIGKRGHVTCSMDYRLHSEESAQSEIQVNKPRVHDTTSHIPSVPAYVNMERDSHSLLRASLPLRALQFGIDEGIAKNNGGLPAGFSVTVMNSRFDGYNPGSLTMRYYIDVDISGPIGARCEVNVAFAIPPSMLENMQVQDVGTVADCKTGSGLHPF